MNTETKMTNQPFEVNIGGEELLLGKDEYNHLMSLGIDFTGDWQTKLMEEKNYNLLVNALFTMSKIDDAWEVIEEHKEDIDFGYIFNTNPDSPCPYFQLKRDAQDVYKYMFDQGIIDDNSYSYFQVLGGSLSDMDFWKEYMKNKTVSEKLKTINECYNGNNPFEVGLIVPIKGTMSFLLEGLQDDELLDDYIIGKYPGVFFDYMTIMDLLSTNHLKKEYYTRYLSICLEMLMTDKDTSKSDNNDANIEALVNVFWSFAYDLCGRNICDMEIDTITKLDSFLDSNLIHKIDEDDVFAVVINSLAFMNYPYRYKKYLTDRSLDICGLDVSEFLLEKNYPYVLSYKLLDFVSTDEFIIKYPFPAVMNCIYNTSTKRVYIDGEIKNIDESLDDLNLETNEKLSKKVYDKCSSDEEFTELSEAVKDFVQRISI